jgi:hypothetical protein
MSEERKLVPDWFPQRFYDNIKSDLDKNGFIEMDWMVSKVSMIATLNYMRAKGFTCQWIEKAHDQFLIKISVKHDNIPEK